MLFEQFEGKRLVGYGCVVTNKKITIEETICYQELQQNFGFGKDEIYIDIMMANVKKRPVLNELLDELERYDRIYITDISELLGKTNKARDYYKRALEKDIELCITDFNHTLFHLHKLSIMIPKLSTPMKLNIEVLMDKFDRFVEEEYEQTKKSGSGRKKCYLNSFTEEWKKLYFDYESYQIDFETALERAKVFGVNNLPTFKNMVADYERTLDYHDDTLSYAEQDPEFIYLPKRIIKRTSGSYEFPEEYLLIKEKAIADGIDIVIDNTNYNKKGFVSETGEDMMFLINNVIYKRYQNLETMKIPRKLRDVDIHFKE